MVFLFSFQSFVVGNLAISSLHSCELFCHFLVFYTDAKTAQLLHSCLAVIVYAIYRVCTES